MKLTVVGCAGSFPSPEAACSAYLLEAEGFRLLVDFGAGSLGPLQRYTDINAIDAVMLTHLHADHIMDACSYVVARRYAPQAPFPPVPLYGPADTPRRLVQSYDGGESLDDVYTFNKLTAGVRDIGPFRVITDLMNHPVETYGIRLEHGGRALTFSADTGQSEALVKLASGSEAFLCEASFLDGEDNPPDLHLTGRMAGEHATRADVGHLLLTHLVWAWGSETRTREEAVSAFAGPLDVVRPGSVYEI